MKIYLGLITSSEETDNIKELTEVYDSFDGLAAVFHGPENECYNILESRKKEGFVAKMDFLQNHSFAMNRFLFDPRIIAGQDWILLRDSAERVNPEFAKNIKGFVQELENNHISVVYNYSKCLLFKKTEDCFFHGSPHWGLQNVSGNAIPLEKMGGLYSDEKNYCYSVRGEKRPDHHWIKHYLSYYLYQSSNHMLLGNENDQPTYKKLEARRRIFRLVCINKYRLNPLLKADDLISYWKTATLDKEDLDFINNEVILNDAYHFFVKGTDYAIIKQNHDNKITVDVK